MKIVYALIMEEYLSMEMAERQKITEKVKQVLSREKELVFAFVFGSFLNSPSFRDVDIAVYAKKIEKNRVFDFEVSLAEKTAKTVSFPIDAIDLKYLNFAPHSFLNNVFSRGQLLFCKDYEFLSNLIEKTSLEALANEYIAQQSLKELVPA